MKVLILYREQSEHGREVNEFIRDFKYRHPDVHLEVLDVDTREGNAMATLYDVVQYPAILILQTDGSLQKCWQGDDFPLMDEISGYALV